ncbi:MAG: ubiquinone biosynthesis protein [Alphaproteobacteria bacterium]|nr:ubiquinone biosynthesis protein [Alphaproteobacteria bacterium]
MAGRTFDDIPEEKVEWIGGYPTPPAPPIRPLHALSSVIKLVRNKEDTRQVFEAVSALSGRSGKRMFRRFLSTDYGRRVIAEPVRLEEILSDRARLRALPEGSFGRAYLAFMEGENLTVEGLRAAAKEADVDFDKPTDFESYRRLFMHTQVSHDLWHVLTGYGRDAIGEMCNLCFTRAQSKNPGFRLIIWVGILAMKRERPDLPIWKAANEARRMGLKAQWVLGCDVEELLPLPLAEARRRLNILTPEIYNSIPDEAKRTILKPKVAETQAQREARLARA